MFSAEDILTKKSTFSGIFLKSRLIYKGIYQMNIHKSVFEKRHTQQTRADHV